MEVKFDIVKPNLYVVEDSVFFGMDSSELIPVSRSVDEIIGKHIGALKVKDSNLDAIESGESVKTQETEKYSTSLLQYLSALEKKAEHRFGGVYGVTNDAVKLFGLDYVIISQTIEKRQDISRWIGLQHDLANPGEAFDGYDKSHLVFRVDRDKTLKEIERLHKELDPKIPDNYAEFFVVTGQIPFSEDTFKRQNLGVVSLTQLKAKDKTKIEEAKSDLIGRLKEVDGPCLSLDAPTIYRQMIELYFDAPELIRRYGDVLKSPM